MIRCDTVIWGRKYFRRWNMLYTCANANAARLWLTRWQRAILSVIIAGSDLFGPRSTAKQGRRKGTRTSGGPTSVAKRDRSHSLNGTWGICLFIHRGKVQLSLPKRETHSSREKSKGTRASSSLRAPSPPTSSSSQAELFHSERRHSKVFLEIQS